MDALVLVVSIGLVLLGGGVLSQRARWPLPLVLIGFGILAGFLPFLRGIALPPELVLLLFLPALLYWESLNTSLREIRANLRTILLLSIVLVIATATVVAIVGHAFGLSWPMAIALGAILSPTDATAVSSFIGKLPRRSDTIARAESLLNDGTALVIYALAVGAAVSGTPIEPGPAVLRFFESYVFGALIGLAVGFAVAGIRRVLGPSRVLHTTMSLLTPFLAYLPAEALGVSGVVSVVVCGLLLSYFGPRIVSAAMREQSYQFWQFATYVLNGALFVLIGLELHPLMGELGSDWVEALVLGLLSAVVILAVRLAWSNTVPYLIRIVDRRPVQRTLRIGFRQRFPLAWAGFRGAVSLAAALALPTETAAGDPLPGRDVVIGVTFVVILFTLVVQGLPMKAIVRWARFPEDPREFDEELLAEQTLLERSLAKLPELTEQTSTSEEAAAAVRADLEHRLSLIHREEGHPEVAQHDDDESAAEQSLRLAIMEVKRNALVDLRNRGRIDDVILRRVQARLDLEELRLTGPPEEE
ncbi:Na+/H+ antiporter [Agromyces protaetiae]|uniref:Na+/H+ antiporter n=1 Tax=Agromyces protaetiae TaxID=2509455 RepID=A0A4V0YGU9_9MICO|nr:Na+/H+ antiporter [Agromyces protaetiae]QAY72471.1 Na+/H+ antiporter [Agromyces protaetiae]